jgi:hypothetical protein
MNEWFGLGFLILLVFGAYFGLRALGKPRHTTEQEFEERVGENRSMVTAAMMELDKFLNPQAAKSIEVIEEMKDGKYQKKQAKGDDEDTDDAEITEQKL